MYRMYRENMPAHNTGLKEMAADEQTESFVHLIYICSGGQ